MDGLGARLRKERLSQGLTQRELAEPQFSAAYISQLERERVRPSVRALEILARKLGRSPTFFLGPPAEPEQALLWERTQLRGELELARRHFDDARAHLQRASEIAGRLQDPLRLAITQLRLGQAEENRNPHESVRRLTSALATFDRQHKTGLAAEAALALGRHHAKSENPLLAVQYFRAAQAHIREGSELEVQCLVALGESYCDMNETEAGLDLLRQATIGARGFVTLGQVAEAWLSQAEELDETGESAAATDLLRRAHALYMALDQLAAAGKALRVAARHKATGPEEYADRGYTPAAIRGWLEQSLLIEEKIDNPLGQAEALLQLAELVLIEDPQAATKHICQALGLAEHSDSHYLRARVLHCWALALDRQGEDSLPKLQLALDALQGEEASPLRARLHREMGEKLRSREQFADALAHFEAATKELERLQGTWNSKVFEKYR